MDAEQQLLEHRRSRVKVDDGLCIERNLPGVQRIVHLGNQRDITQLSSRLRFALPLLGHVSEDDDRPEPASALILERIGARREHPLTALTADVDVHVCDRLAPHRTHKGKLVSG